jgi:hypothetical protein
LDVIEELLKVIYSGRELAEMEVNKKSSEDNQNINLIDDKYEKSHQTAKHILTKKHAFTHKHIHSSKSINYHLNFN